MDERNFLKQLYLYGCFCYDEERQEYNRKEIYSLVDALAESVNSFGFSPEYELSAFTVFIEENNPKHAESSIRIANIYLYHLALQWVYFWGMIPESNADQGNPKHYYISVDDRNRECVRRCRILACTPVFRDCYKLIFPEEINYDDPYQNIDVCIGWYRLFMMRVNSNMHKTNIQTATGWMFQALGSTIPELHIHMLELWGNGYSHLVMI